MGPSWEWSLVHFELTVLQTYKPYCHYFYICPYMPWICPSQVRGVLSASFLRVLSHCARSESNLLLTHQSSLRRNLIWSTCSVVCFYILPYASILLL